MAWLVQKCNCISETFDMRILTLKHGKRWEVGYILVLDEPKLQLG